MFLYLAILHILNGFDLHCKLQSDYNSFSMRVWSKKKERECKTTTDEYKKKIFCVFNVGSAISTIGI